MKKAIDYMKNQEVRKMVEAGNTYQKIAETYLRLPKESEIGSKFITYVKVDGGIRVESVNKVSVEVIIAQNPTILAINSNGENIYNEYLISREIAIKNYGIEAINSLSKNSFSSHIKKATVTGVFLTDKIMEILGCFGDTLEIKVDWSNEPMIVKVGDYITTIGYSISAHDMKDYELVG